MRARFLLRSVVVIAFTLWSGLGWGQTTVFNDDFTTNTNAIWTTSGSIGSSSWSVSRSGVDWGARRNTSPMQLELTNTASTSTNVNGWVFAYTSASSFQSPYSTTLSSNSGLITWYFNMRQARTDPAGFGAGSYGVAFVLGTTNTTANNSGTGYAIVLGQSGSTDPIRLSKFSGGLSTGLTNIISSNTSGLTDFGTEYLSIKVTYNPLNNEWELFIRNDGTSSFVDPSSGTLISQGTAIDNTYTGIDLSFTGGYWQGSTGADQTAFFNNIKVTVNDGGSSNIAPSITNITQTPSSDITSTTTVSVSADVTDSDGAVELVELRWGLASDALNNTITMAKGTGDTYTTDSNIPAQAHGAKVYYRIFAEDDESASTLSIISNYSVFDPQTTTIPYEETFNANLGKCYTYSVSGSSKFWIYGSASGNGYAAMNGHNSGDTEEDWLILPGLNLDSYGNPRLTFDSWYNFGTDDENNFLKLKYSTDYAGIGNPSSATWQELTFTKPSAAQAWTSSGNIDLSAIEGTSVWIAFKYRYEVGKYRSWQIDNINIIDANSPLLSVTPSTLSALSYIEGNGPSASKEFKVSGTNLDPSAGNISVSAAGTDYELSLSNSTFSSTVTIPYTDGAATEVSVWVRLKAGLSAGDFNNQVVQISGGGASSINVTVSGTVSSPPPSLTAIGVAYEQNFSAFNSAGTIPNGWNPSDQTYGGDWGTGTGAGLRGNASVFGFQLTAASNFFSTTLTLINNTGSSVENLKIDYLGKVARTTEARHPEWTVKVNNSIVPELAYSTASGLDEEKTVILTGLNIANGEAITIEWSSDGNVGTTGSRRQIGVSNVSITAIEIEDIEPSITISENSLTNFGNVYTDHFSNVQFYSVDAEGLTENLVITAPAGFKISEIYNNNFEESLSLTPVGGVISGKKIYVRFYPTSAGSVSGSITHTSAGAETKNLAVEAKGVAKDLGTYYSTISATRGEELMVQLHKLIRGHSVSTYDAIWTHFQSTDKKYNGKVWDIYSDSQDRAPNYEFTFVDDQDTGTEGTAEGQKYNREHSFPKSWWGGSQTDTMHMDIFHIYPTDKFINAERSNWPFGVVSTPSTTFTNGSKLGSNSFGGVYTSTAFEPIEEYKGDLARSYFYMATRYYAKIDDWGGYSDALNGTSYPAFEPWVVDMLLEWHHNDPVSQKEVDRNNAIATIQGNRNPFIDNPEWVTAIWQNKEEPSNHVTGLAATDISSVGVTVTWTDAVGTILPDGYLAMLKDATGEFQTPVDGTPIANDNDLADGLLVSNVEHMGGANSVSFAGLVPNVEYTVVVYPYTNAGVNINYKIDGTIPQHQFTTLNYPHIVSISSVSPISVDYETLLADAIAALPAQTSITDSDDASHPVNLSWTISDYNGNVPGDYSATGTFTLPTGVIQSDPETELKVTTTVTVLDRVVSFDVDANWIQDGATSLASYANHAYADHGVMVQGTNVLRNTTSAQDGFPGALGTHSVRIGNTAVSKVTITVAEGGVSDFSLMVRRWDNSPMPNYTVKYSYDGGTHWNSLPNIDGSLLETSDWYEYNGQVDKAHSNIKIEIANTGTTERIMVDNFKWIGYNDTEPPIISVTPANNEVDVDVSINPTITFSESIRNIDNSEITDDNITDLIHFQSGGVDVPFTASINSAKTVITIIPSSTLDYETEYGITLAPVEDQFNNSTTELLSVFTTMVAPKFTVTYSVVEVDSETNGTLSAKVGETAITSGDEVIIGSSLEFTAAPINGFRVKEWKLNGAVQADETDNVFTILNLQSDVEVTVEFTPILVETIGVSGDGSSSVVFGQTLQMLATISPTSALEKGVAWSITEGGTGTATVSETGLLTATGVGTVTVRATTKEAGSSVFGEATVTITKATASVTLSNLSPTYNATPRAVGITTVPAGLTVDVTYNGSATVPVNAGSYEVVATVDETNYQGSASGTLIVGKASLTITAKDIVKILGAVYEFVGDEYDVSGLWGSDRVTDVSFTSDGALAEAVVGDYDIVPSDAQGDGLENYTISYVNGTMSVTDKTVLTISGVTAQDRVYDGTTTATISNYGSLNGVVDGDVVSLNTTGVMAAFSSKVVGVDKVVNVSGFTLEGADANKYILGSINLVTASITPKSIEIVGVQVQNKVYDGTTTATMQGAELSGLISGDLVEINTQTATFATKDVGNGISVSAVFTIKGDDVGNYWLNQPTGLVANITPIPITITADAKTKIYGEVDPTLTYQITAGALVGDDQFSGSLNRTEGEAVSTYAIDQGTLTAGGNYSITFVSASLTITPKPLTVTGALAQNKVYDGTTSAVISSASLLGVLADDDVQIDQAVGNFASKDVGDDIAVTSAITVKGDDVANYSLVQPTGLKANITPVNLTITADAVSKVYGQVDPAFTYQITVGALVGDETLSGSLNRAAGEDVNTYAITQGTLTAGSNYNLVFVSANFTILPKELTIGGSFTVDNKKFDGTTSAAISSNALSLNGIVGDDVVTLTNVVAAFTSFEIGNDILVAIESANLTGADAFNYSLSLAGAPTTTASIFTTNLTVTFSVVVVGGLTNGTLTAAVNGTSIISGDEAEAGSDVNFTASPAAGYQVKEWTLNGNVVTGNVANTYTVTNLSHDITVTVEFMPIPPTMYSIQFSVVVVDGSTNGTITATVNSTPISSGDEVEQGKEVIFTATPSAGYRVKAWFLNSQVVLGHTALTYSVSNLDDNIEVGVEFESESQTVSYPVLFSVVEVAGQTNGTISASVNDDPIASGDFVEQGSSIVFNAMPNEGFELDVWILNGDEDPSISMLAITYPDLSMAIDVRVRFKEIVISTYTVSFSVVQVGNQANGIVSASANGSSIESGQTVAEGSALTFTATPDQGFRVMEWRLNGNVTGTTSNTYSIASLTSDVSVTVNFEPIPPTTYSLTFNVIEVGGATNGTLTATVASQSITSGAQVEQGSNIDFTATPNQGYRVKEWKLNGAVIEGLKEQTYTLSNLTQTTTVTVEFEVITSAGTISLANLKAYPNPFTNFISIESSVDVTRVIISNVIGKRVMEILLNGESSINTSSLIDGIYLITFENAKGVVRKMIKR